MDIHKPLIIIVAILLKTVNGYISQIYSQKTANAGDQVYLTYEFCGGTRCYDYATSDPFTIKQHLKIATPNTDCDVSVRNGQCFFDEFKFQNSSDKKVTEQPRNDCKLCALVVRNARPEDAGVYSLCRLDGAGICHTPQNISLGIRKVTDNNIVCEITYSEALHRTVNNCTLTSTPVPGSSPLSTSVLVTSPLTTSSSASVTHSTQSQPITFTDTLTGSERTTRNLSNNSRLEEEKDLSNSSRLDEEKDLSNSSRLDEEKDNAHCNSSTLTTIVAVCVVIIVALVLVLFGVLFFFIRKFRRMNKGSDQESHGIHVNVNENKTDEHALETTKLTIGPDLQNDEV